MRFNNQVLELATLAVLVELAMVAVAVQGKESTPSCLTALSTRSVCGGVVEAVVFPSLLEGVEEG